MRLTNASFSIASLVSNSLKGLEIDTKIKEHSCILVWDEVVGDQVSAAAQPEFVRDGKLFVTAKSSVWANELTFYKTDMIAKLNRRVGGAVLKDIIFKAGRITPKRVRKETAQSDPALESIRLTDAEMAQIRSTAESAGEELSDGLVELLATAARLEKWKRLKGWTPCRVCGALQHSATGICPPCETARHPLR